MDRCAEDFPPWYYLDVQAHLAILDVLWPSRNYPGSDVVNSPSGQYYRWSEEKRNQVQQCYWQLSRSSGNL